MDSLGERSETNITAPPLSEIKETQEYQQVEENTQEACLSLLMEPLVVLTLYVQRNFNFLTTEEREHLLSVLYPLLEQITQWNEWPRSLINLSLCHYVDACEILLYEQCTLEERERYLKRVPFCYHEYLTKLLTDVDFMLSQVFFEVRDVSEAMKANLEARITRLAILRSHWDS